MVQKYFLAVSAKENHIYFGRSSKSFYPFLAIMADILHQRAALRNRGIFMANYMESKTNHYKAGIRLVALFVCVLFLAASLLSSAYLLTHMNHNHDHTGHGGTCSTCAHITAAETFLKQIGTAAIMAMIVFGFRIFDLFILKPTPINSYYYSLVALKVRLDN
jgi:hypothetical protein